MFRKKNREPRSHVGAQRLIFVPAPLAETSAQLAAHGDLVTSAAAAPQPMQLAYHRGWSVVSTKAAIHPWAFHNLSCWMLDTGPGNGGDRAGRGLVVRCEPAPIAVASPGLTIGYTVASDPELDSCLSGQFDNGTPLSVYVPTNDHNATESVPRPVAIPFAVEEALDLLVGVPPTPVLLEDPGHDLNPENSASVRSRSALIPAPGMW